MPTKARKKMNEALTLVDSFIEEKRGHYIVFSYTRNITRRKHLQEILNAFHIRGYEYINQIENCLVFKKIDGPEFVIEDI